jgi:hypothetical protein
MITKEYIRYLKQQYGVSIPRKDFSPEIYNRLIDFKQSHERDWLTDEYLYATANIDRYTAYFQS